MGYVTKPTTLMKMWATSGVKEQPNDSKIQQGWVVELPPYQFDNWLENRQDTFIAHVNQVGIPAWDAVTDYQGGKSYVQGSDGIVYKALVTNTNVDPTNPLNSSTWVRAFEDYGSVQVVQTALNNHLTNYSTLAGISNVTAARNNLSVYSKNECDNNFALKPGSVSQTFHVADATADTHAINKAQLYSLLNQATETVKGIAEIASQSEMNVGTNDTNIVTPLKGKATYLMRSNNLSDLTNIPAAKNVLGVRDVGTSAGTVAAGDDARIVNSVQNWRTVSAGNGLTGGGALSNNVILSLGNPSTIGAYSSNSVSATSHSHAFDINSFFGDRGLAANGWYTLPGGFKIMWGRHNMGGGAQTQTVYYPKNFDSQVFSIIMTRYEAAALESGIATVKSWNTNSFTFANTNANTYTEWLWIAVGV
jgi:hypothetical protein